MSKEEIKVPIPEEYSTVEEWAKSLMEQRRAVRMQRNVVSEDGLSVYADCTEKKNNFCNYSCHPPAGTPDGFAQP